MYRYRLQQSKRVERESDGELASKASYEVLRNTLAQTEFSLLRHIKSGELYGVYHMAFCRFLAPKMQPLARILYRLVGLKYSSKPFKL